MSGTKICACMDAGTLIYSYRPDTDHHGWWECRYCIVTWMSLIRATQEQLPRSKYLSPFGLSLKFVPDKFAVWNKNLCGRMVLTSTTENKTFADKSARTSSQPPIRQQSRSCGNSNQQHRLSPYLI